MLGVIVVLSCIITISLVLNGNYFEKSKNKVEELLADEKTSLIYLGRPTCPFCAQMEPYLNQYSKDFDITYHYINTDNLREDELSEILAYFGVSLYDFGTPYMVTVANGNKTDELKGFQGPEYLVDFLKRTGYIPKDAKIDGIEEVLDEEDFNNLKAQLQDKVNSTENNIIFFNSQTCIHCLNMKPVLNQYAGENNFDYFNLSTDNLTFEQLDELLKIVDSTIEGFGTPYTVVVKEGKRLFELRGYPGEEELESFLKNTGFIN